jgi:hypothetical protein
MILKISFYSAFFKGQPNLASYIPALAGKHKVHFLGL